MRVGRNDPCPCGSGRKYKRCHLDEDAARDRAAARALEERVVEHDGERLLVSPNVTSEQMEVAAEYFRERREGRGPAKQMVAFLQPLLDETDGSPEQMNRVMQLGMLWWNLAILPDSAREEALTSTVNELSADEEVRQEFRRVAAAMIERHRAMFPGLHARER